MDQTTIELAIQALEAEKAKVEGAIAELKTGLNGQKAAFRTEAGGGEMPTPFVAPAKPGGRRGKRGMTAAGRKALSDAAKRRWVKARKSGKSTL